MNSLIIEQNSIPEIVDESIIHKLYEKVKEIPEPNEGEEDNAYLSGNLQTQYSYRSEAQYLTTRFPNLFINATEGYYISFEDSNLPNYLNSKGIGSGGKVTESQAVNAQSVSNSSNSTIKKFNELKYFTNITESKGGFTGVLEGNCKFLDWTALEEVDISNFTSLGHDNSNGYGDTFSGCISLQTVTNSNKLTKIGFKAFNNCSELRNISTTTNVTYFGDYCFYNCNQLQYLDITKATTIGYASFQSCKNISEFSTINCPNLTGTLKSLAFAECTQIKDVTNLGNITQIGEEDLDQDPFYGCSNLETIIIPETVTNIEYFLCNAPKVKWVKLLCNSVPATNINHYGCFGEQWNPSQDRTGTYTGKAYSIYVKDELYNDYISDGSIFQMLAGLGRIKKLSQFELDFPTE